MSILISPTLANDQTSYYALATISGGVVGVSSFTNGGQIDCSSGTGAVTLTNTGVISLSAAATANGLSLTSNVGSIVVNYNTPAPIQQPLVNYLDITSWPAVTLSAGQTEELYRWNYGGIVTNAIQVTMGIINSNSPYFTYTRTTGVPNLVLWVGPLGLTTPPANMLAGQSLSIVDEAVTGQMEIPQNLIFVATATNYQSGGTTDYWALYATNGSSGDTAFTIPGSNYGTWKGSYISSLAAVV
jgi:hypothetical protein